MKKIKNYIEADLAKKKITRYKYWSIKDENGITITSSEDEAEGRNFGEMLDKIIADNVDAEVQIKYGTNEQSSRQNPPFFIRVNETIEWIEPEEETIQINGVPHKLDKNGNVNINLTSPTPTEDTKTEVVQIDTFRQELDMQLQGIRREHELKEERWKMDMHNKLLEQNIQFKEMLLSDRENKIAEREQQIAIQEAQLEEKQQEIREDVKGYVKQIPNVLGGVVKDWIKNATTKNTPLSGTENETAPKKVVKKQRPVQFSMEQEDTEAVSQEKEIQESEKEENTEVEFIEELHDDIEEFQELEDVEMIEEDNNSESDNTSTTENTNPQNIIEDDL